MNKLTPVTCLLGAIVLQVFLHLLCPVGCFVGFPWRFVGLAPLGAGIAMNLLADRAFKARSTTVKPFEQPAVLITDGLFRVSRNPMYLGMALMLLGVALLLGSVLPFLPIFAFVLLIHRYFIVREERLLEHAFGDQFHQYRSRVRRWI